MSEMIEVKTSDLLGAALDWAVSFTEGPDHWSSDRPIDWWRKCREYRPSEQWIYGGPLIDENDISIANSLTFGYWASAMIGARQPGPTRLVAACRALVSAKIGDTVSVPACLL